MPWWYSFITAFCPTTSGSSLKVSTSLHYWWRPFSLRRDTSTGTSSLVGVRRQQHPTSHIPHLIKPCCKVLSFSFMISAFNRNPHSLCHHLGGAEATLWWYRVGWEQLIWVWWWSSPYQSLSVSFVSRCWDMNDNATIWWVIKGPVLASIMVQGQSEMVHLSEHNNITLKILCYK